MKNIYLSLLLFFILFVSVFAWPVEDQQFIESHFSKIESEPIPKTAIDDFNDLPAAARNNIIIPYWATYSYAESRNLLNDGVSWPITTSAYNAVNTALSSSSSTSASSSTSSSSSGAPWPCDFDVNSSNDIAGALDNCLTGSDLIDSSWDTLIEWSLKDTVTAWTVAIAQLLSLLAVGAIVYGGLLMTLSAWDEEKIKKGKDVVKWAILGFLWVVLAWALVRIVVEVIFSVAS